MQLGHFCKGVRASLDKAMVSKYLKVRKNARRVELKLSRELTLSEISKIEHAIV